MRANEAYLADAEVGDELFSSAVDALQQVFHWRLEVDLSAVQRDEVRLGKGERLLGSVLHLDF